MRFDSRYLPPSMGIQDILQEGTSFLLSITAVLLCYTANQGTCEIQLSDYMSLGLKGKVTYWLQGFSHWQGIYYTIQKPEFLQNWPEPEPENLELPNRDNGRIDSWIETNPIILSVGEEGNCCAHQSRWVTEFGAQRVKIPLEHKLASFHALGGKCRCNLRVNVWLLIEYKGADGST